MVMSSLLVAKAHDGRQRKPRGDAYHHLGAGDHRCQCRPCTAGLQSESAELTHRDPIMCASAGGIGAGRGATCTTGSNQPECDRRSCYGKHRDLGVDFSAFFGC